MDIAPVAFKLVGWLAVAALLSWVGLGVYIHGLIPMLERVANLAEKVARFASSVGQMFTDASPQQRYA